MTALQTCDLVMALVPHNIELRKFKICKFYKGVVFRMQNKKTVLELSFNGGKQ